MPMKACRSKANDSKSPKQQGPHRAGLVVSTRGCAPGLSETGTDDAHTAHGNRHDANEHDSAPSDAQTPVKEPPIERDGRDHRVDPVQRVGDAIAKECRGEHHQERDANQYLNQAEDDSDHVNLTAAFALRC